MQGVCHSRSIITDYDIYLFKQGRHFDVYEKLGSHIVTLGSEPGTFFAVWAPCAEFVSVIGDHNSWDNNAHPLKRRGDGSGVWEGFIPGVAKGTRYKYRIHSRLNGFKVDKADPYAFFCEPSPGTASRVWDMRYEWDDARWMSSRQKTNSLKAPISIYEVHAGSFMRCPEEGGRFLTYRELAHKLCEYVVRMGFTHVELMPLAEHPFYGSWGYQVLGYFAATSRYGEPQDLMYLVDYLHRHGIGVILDWVPSHFPSDEHGLVYFDGTHLYEHSDPRVGFHPEWKSYIFNYGRNEVKNFLISNALFWLDKYHIDGLRVDGVASMLYRDYARKHGEWIPNENGGRENLQAVDFIKALNNAAYGAFKGIQMIAEESTAWPGVSRPVYTGGLGFGMKWNMGWMHDSLKYMSKDPVYRKHHHRELTFSIWYAFYENFILGLSHDEVVYGKKSLLEKMPGDNWQKFANLRLLFGYMYTHPGKKLLFMGGEFGQRNEWFHEQSLDWHLTQEPLHKGVMALVRELNNLYRQNTAFYLNDFELKGFEWIDYGDWQRSVISYLRRGEKENDVIAVACNFTPLAISDYLMGVPISGLWREILNSDHQIYSGSGQTNPEPVEARSRECSGRPFSLQINLPPLGITVFKPVLKQNKNVI